VGGKELAKMKRCQKNVFARKIPFSKTKNVVMRDVPIQWYVIVFLPVHLYAVNLFVVNTKNIVKYMHIKQEV
jgi:hypothetical protein